MINKKAKKRSVETPSAGVENLAAKAKTGNLHKKKKLSAEVPTQNGAAKKLKQEKKQQKTQEFNVEKSENSVNKAVKNVTLLGESKNKKKAESEKNTLLAQKLAKLEGRQKARAKRKLQKVKKAESGKVQPEKTPETLKQRIDEIRSRETLTKTAKRKLGILLRKLRALEQGESEPKAIIPDSKSTTEKSDAAKTVKLVKGTKLEKGIVNQATADGKNKQANPGASGKVLAKAKVQTKKQTVVEQASEEDDEDESEDEVEDELEAEQSDEDDDGDDDADDDENNDGTETDEADSEPETKILPTKKGKPVAEKQKNQQGNKEEKKSEAKGKKKRYVLFVGQLPDNVSEETVKKHFLTKCTEVVSVRMPKQSDSDKNRGFAYVEFNNHEDYEKGFSLHHSFINGRRINVQYSEKKGNSQLPKKNVIAKNKKLQALSKTGKFGGTENNKKKKFVGKKNKQNAKV